MYNSYDNIIMYTSLMYDISVVSYMYTVIVAVYVIHLNNYKNIYWLKIINYSLKLSG